MSRLASTCFAVACAGVVAAYGQYADLIPAPKLSSADAFRFHPELIRLHEEDMAEVRTILSRDLNRPDLAAVVTRPTLRKLPLEGWFFAAFLNASSEGLREWTLRTLGEFHGDKTTALPGLLGIVANPRASDAERALAARVVGTIDDLNVESLSLLAGEVGAVSPELSTILLEVIGKHERATATLVPALKRHLQAPDASVQFYAFRAIQQIEQRSRIDGEHLELGVHYTRARRLWQPHSDVTLAQQVLVDRTAPKYVTCLALLNLNKSAGATSAILSRTGDNDPFVAKLAQNVLRSAGNRSVPALTQGLASTNAAIRLSALLQLRDLGPQARDAAVALVSMIERVANGERTPMSVREVGICLDVLRGIGTNAPPAPQALLALLDERSPVYRNADKHEVHRLRGWVLATLAENGVSLSALPAITTSLATSDRAAAIEFAGAARAAGALGYAARDAVPFLLRALEERLDEDLIAFDRFDSHGNTAAEYTSCQVEALRALARIGSATPETLEAVRRFLAHPWPELAESPDLSGVRRVPDLRREASRTLASMEVNRDEKN